jgi:hypothetical protein
MHGSPAQVRPKTPFSSRNARPVQSGGPERAGRSGRAVTYGWIAQRVFYGRFVGSLSAELGTSFVERLSMLISDVPALAYFADASALEQYDFVARTAQLGGPTDLCTDPAEFDRALSNVALPRTQAPLPGEPVWQVHAPR